MRQHPVPLKEGKRLDKKETRRAALEQSMVFFKMKEAPEESTGRVHIDNIVLCMTYQRYGVCTRVTDAIESPYIAVRQPTLAENTDRSQMWDVFEVLGTVYRCMTNDESGRQPMHCKCKNAHRSQLEISFTVHMLSVMKPLTYSRTLL